MTTVARAIVLVFLITPAASAQVTQAQMEKLWGKYAVGFFQKPKMGCVCFDGANDFRLGSMVKFGSRAACYLPGFDADGELTSQSPCNGPFAPLAR